MASGLLMQLSTYMDKRMSMLISTTGASAVVINTNPDDLLGSPPVGITIPANGNFLLTHVLHGELIWEVWWANCTTNVITVWEWFCSSNLPGQNVTPTRTLCESPQVGANGTCSKPKKKCTTIQEEQKKKLIDILNKYKAGPNGLVVTPPTLPPLDFNENPIANPNPLDPSSQSPSGYYNANGAWVIGVEGEY